MKKFKDFGIVPVATNPLIGQKIKMSKVLNRLIIVHDFRIRDSQYTGKRVDIQIELAGVMHVIFSGSKVLRDTLEKIPKSDFPFETTIEEENQMFVFK